MKKYRNLIEWALAELAHSDKNKLVELVNRYGETNYNVNHLNNWLSQRKPLPSKIHTALAGRLLDTVTFKDRAHIKRLILHV